MEYFFQVGTHTVLREKDADSLGSNPSTNSSSKREDFVEAMRKVQENIQEAHVELGSYQPSDEEDEQFITTS